MIVHIGNFLNYGKILIDLIQQLEDNVYRKDNYCCFNNVIKSINSRQENGIWITNEINGAYNRFTGSIMFYLKDEDNDVKYTIKFCNIMNRFTTVSEFKISTGDMIGNYVLGDLI